MVFNACSIESNRVWRPVEYAWLLPWTLFRLTRVQEASIFLKKRAVLEEDFGRTMHKLAATSQMAYTANECKAGYVCTFPDICMLFELFELHGMYPPQRLRGVLSGSLPMRPGSPQLRYYMLVESELKLSHNLLCVFSVQEIL
jgi:hypothetical protein